MTNNIQRKILKEYNFHLTDAYHHGIYQSEVYENEFFKFVLVLDKAYHECYVYSKGGDKKGGPILKIIREIRHDENYLKSDLSERHNASKLMPDTCIKILVENYEALKQHLAVDKFTPPD